MWHGEIKSSWKTSINYIKATQYNRSIHIIFCYATCFYSAGLVRYAFPRKMLGGNLEKIISCYYPTCHQAWHSRQWNLSQSTVQMMHWHSQALWLLTASSRALPEDFNCCLLAKLITRLHVLVPSWNEDKASRGAELFSLGAIVLSQSRTEGVSLWFTAADKETNSSDSGTESSTLKSSLTDGPVSAGHHQQCSTHSFPTILSKLLHTSLMSWCTLPPFTCHTVTLPISKDTLSSCCYCILLGSLHQFKIFLFSRDTFPSH